MNNESTKLMYAELKPCTTVSMVFDVVRKYYDLNASKPGTIAKTLFAQALPDDLKNSSRDIQKCTTIAEMFTVIERNHNTTTYNLTAVNKLVTNLPKAINMLRPVAFKQYQ